MSAYPQGTPVTLSATFEVADASASSGYSLADPTTVTFEVRAPDGSVASYVFGTAAEVARLSVGSYQCRLSAAEAYAPGEYHYEAVGTGAVEVALPGDFAIIPSSVTSPPPGGPTLGPCTSWISGADVVACCPAASGKESSLLDAVAVEASMALFEISGRQFSGLCPQTVRPQRTDCGCWGTAVSSGLPWYWSGGALGWQGWGWWNETGDRRGCQPLSVVRLAGYPVRAITAVKVDGVVLPAVDVNGNPNYRLDGWRELVRMADPGPPYQQRFWPSCQNLDLDDTQPGTFSVSYECGVDPPQIGRDAAAALACQLWQQFNGQACAIPTGATKITRQGVEVDRQLLANWFDPTKSTGIPVVDLFLKAYWRNRTARRSAVWSPDVAGFAKRVGT